MMAKCQEPLVIHAGSQALREATDGRSRGGAGQRSAVRKERYWFGTGCFEGATKTVLEDARHPVGQSRKEKI
ncbi:hypothetical protein CGU36_21965 [Pseudomonas fluorescens]|nr:hypothetical protein CGU36_21965 [Pseudomonas fluorescens]